MGTTSEIRTNRGCDRRAATRLEQRRAGRLAGVRRSSPRLEPSSYACALRWAVPREHRRSARGTSTRLSSETQNGTCWLPGGLREKLRSARDDLSEPPFQGPDASTTVRHAPARARRRKGPWTHALVGTTSESWRTRTSMRAAIGDPARAPRFRGGHDQHQARRREGVRQSSPRPEPSSYARALRWAARREHRRSARGSSTRGS